MSKIFNAFATSIIYVHIWYEQDIGCLGSSVKPAVSGHWLPVTLYDCGQLLQPSSGRFHRTPLALSWERLRPSSFWERIWHPENASGFILRTQASFWEHLWPRSENASGLVLRTPRIFSPVQCTGHVRVKVAILRVETCLLGFNTKP